MRVYNNLLVVLFLAFFVTGIYVAFYSERNSKQLYDQVLPASTQVPQSDSSESSKTTKVTFNYDCQKGKTAYELLYARHELNLKEGEVEPVVMGIDGYKVGEKEFWALYVDGKKDQESASKYRCINNEKIQWKVDTF